MSLRTLVDAVATRPAILSLRLVAFNWLLLKCCPLDGIEKDYLREQRHSCRNVGAAGANTHTAVVRDRMVRKVLCYSPVEARSLRWKRYILIKGTSLRGLQSGYNISLFRVPDLFLIILIESFFVRRQARHLMSQW